LEEAQLPRTKGTSCPTQGMIIIVSPEVARDNIKITGTSRYQRLDQLMISTLLTTDRDRTIIPEKIS
jgi:hypothetical protein